MTTDCRPIPDRPSPPPRRPRIGRAALAVALAAALAAACAEAPDARRSLLLVTLDTTRADHVGAYGYVANTMPHLDALALRGALFENCYAPMPQTLPSHATLFTGLAPREHGVLENAFVLLEDVSTLAEQLAAEGYRTAAFVGARVLTTETGIDQGFEVFDEPTGPPRSNVHPAERKADEVTDAALRWLQDVEPDEPAFVWVHFYDPHGPFDPPYDRVRPVARRPIMDHVLAMPQFENGVGILSAEDIGRLWHGYALELSYTDQELGRLLAGFEAVGRGEQTAVVVVGDHGEGLGEHNEKGHGVNVYEEQLRVPLVVHVPGAAAPVRVRTPVTLSQLHPTMLELALGAPLAGSLVPAVLRGAEPPTQPIFVERPHYTEDRADWRKLAENKRGDLVAVVLGREKLIRRPDGSHLYYDLDVDPEELRSAHEDEPERVARLAGLIDQWLAEHEVDAAPPTMSEERLRDLRALGYVGDDG